MVNEHIRGCLLASFRRRPSRSLLAGATLRYLTPVLTRRPHCNLIPAPTRRPRQKFLPPSGTIRAKENLACPHRHPSAPTVRPDSPCRHALAPDQAVRHLESHAERVRRPAPPARRLRRARPQRAEAPPLAAGAPSRGSSPARRSPSLFCRRGAGGGARPPGRRAGAILAVVLVNARSARCRKAAPSARWPHCAGCRPCRFGCCATAPRQVVVLRARAGARRP